MSTEESTDRKPIESWMTIKRHFVERTQPNGTKARVPSWRFAAAKAGERWPTGLELTEAEYDAAIERAQNGAHR